MAAIYHVGTILTIRLGSLVSLMPDVGRKNVAWVWVFLLTYILATDENLSQSQRA